MSSPAIQEHDMTVLLGDVREQLALLAAGSVNCIVTSPPYYGLRDYGVDGQIGLEPSPAEYVAEMVAVFREARRVLADDGVLWLNIGDSIIDGQLQQIPASVALALRADGWRLCMENIWRKVTNTREKLRKRSTLAHESIFQFTKSGSYYFDSPAVAEATSRDGRPQWARAQQLFGAAGLTDAHLAAMRSVGATDVGKGQGQSGFGRNTAEKQRLAAEAKAALGGYYREFLTGEIKNRRSVWEFDADPVTAPHVAPFPSGLPERCILASTRRGGTVLDPFAGSGTTLMTARKLGRKSVGIELNPAYIGIIRARIGPEPFNFGEVTA